VLGEQVGFELECVDRMYCNAYVPKLSRPGGVASFLPASCGEVRVDVRGGPDQQGSPTTNWYAAKHDIPFVRFATGGGREDDVALEHLERVRERVGSLHDRGGHGTGRR
jgi:hypothetical protein